MYILHSLPIIPLLLALTTAQSIYPGDGKWAYQGCYNETTLSNGTDGLRALSATTETNENMTVSKCLTFCAGGGNSWAGLEYTKECYCANYLSSISAKLDDKECNLPCVGNSSEICGGALKLTVYEVQEKKKGGAGEVRACVGSVMALGVAVVGFLGLV